MNNISGFLQKFLKFESDNNYKLSSILETIKEIVGVQIKKEDLEFKNESVIIKCNPVLRNEIFMYKNKIEDSLKSKKVFIKFI